VAVANFAKRTPKATAVAAPTPTVETKVPINTGCSHCRINSLGSTCCTAGRVVVTDVVVLVVVAIQSNRKDKILFNHRNKIYL